MILDKAILLILLSFFSLVLANSAIELFPAIVNPITPDNNSECFTCIRNGWVWCSLKWNYEAPGTYAAS